MKWTYIMFACLITSIVVGEDINGTDRSYEYIQSMGYDYFLAKSKSEISKSCAVNEMAAYGIMADATSMSEHNDICPQMSGNCCGAEAQNSIRRYWRDDDRHQSQFHTAFLRMHKYILGSVKNYVAIANYVIDQSNKIKLTGGKPATAQPGKNEQQADDGMPYVFEYHDTCEKSAREFIMQDFVNRAKAQGFYEKLTRKAEFMQNARRGFYCMLCSSTAKDYISTNRFGFPSFLWYSKDFCQMIYSQAFPSIYQIYKSYNPFLKHLLKMLMCIKPKGTGANNAQGGSSGQPGAKEPGAQLTFTPMSLSVDLKISNPMSSLTKQMRNMLDNPLNIAWTKKFNMELCYNTDPNSFTFTLSCMGFCENFNVARASRLMDGDIEATKAIYDTLIQYEFAHISSSSNIFGDDVFAMKKNIYEVTQALNHNYFFFRSLAKNINLGTYSIQFSPLFKGINPMALSQGTSLEFKYKSYFILRAVVALALTLFYVN